MKKIFLTTTFFVFMTGSAFAANSDPICDQRGNNNPLLRVLCGNSSTTSVETSSRPNDPGTPPGDDNEDPDSPPDNDNPESPPDDDDDKDKDNNGIGNGDEGDCQGSGCDDSDNPGIGRKK